MPRAPAVPQDDRGEERSQKPEAQPGLAPQREPDRPGRQERHGRRLGEISGRPQDSGGERKPAGIAPRGRLRRQEAARQEHRNQQLRHQTDTEENHVGIESHPRAREHGVRARAAPGFEQAQVHQHKSRERDPRQEHRPGQVAGKSGKGLPDERQQQGIERRVLGLEGSVRQAQDAVTVAFGERLAADPVHAVVVEIAQVFKMAGLPGQERRRNKGREEHGQNHELAVAGSHR